MAKVLLIEDDNSLREIFEIRLQGEGYETVTAGDGEEGLTVAMREKPDLIISDVMMPKLSGFEMLETLRASPEMADTKVVMMTALGQAEDRARGEKLGVVKYLVKSQVTLEDFIRVVREVLQPDQGSTGAQASPPATDAAKASEQENNNKGSEQVMSDDTQNATPPVGGDNAQSTNPTDDNAAAGDVGASNPAPAADQQQAVDQQVNDFVASTPAAPAADSSAPASDAGAGSLGTESQAPAGDASAAPSGDAPAEPPAQDGGEQQPPAAPGSTL